ncbi:MAG: hypothetical protein ACI97A_002934 [Planctomycetota bacterium]|jgi:hypothetical protein
MIIPFLQLIRFPNVFTAMSNVAVGYAVLVQFGKVEPQWLDLGLAGLGAMMLYGFGMALNDIADSNVDRELHPERPIPSGRLTLKNAKIAAWSLLAGGILLLGVASPALILVAILLAIAIGLYDVILKSTPIPASVAMGTCRALCVLLGTVLAATHADDPEVLLRWTTAQLPLVYLLLITLVTAISNFEEAEPGQADFKPLVIVLALAFATPVLVPGDDRILALVLAVILMAVVLRPGFGPKPIAGLVVRNVIFALPLFDALWCLALGQLAFAMISATCFVLVRVSARALSQNSA